MLILTQRHRREIVKHAVADYPYECCGFLVGSRSGGRRRVIRLFRAENVFDGDRRRRFEIAPERYLELEKSLRGTGEEIIGYYHSHPRSRAFPSRIDLSMAWENMSYIITEVPRDGEKGDSVSILRCFRIHRRLRRFVPERMTVERA